MSNAKRKGGIGWTRERAALLALVCLAAGIAGGWLLHGAPKAAQVAGSPAASAPAPQQARTPDQLKAATDDQAAPMLEQLKTHPNDASLLANLGNVYYDGQQYATAVDYYNRSLTITPDDAAVRTDMGTAYWYMGNIDAALGAFDKALGTSPDNPNTLFNRGLVLWRGKHDAAGASADWNRLLAKAPKYQGRAQVEAMLAEVKAQTGGK